MCSPAYSLEKVAYSTSEEKDYQDQLLHDTKNTHNPGQDAQLLDIPSYSVALHCFKTLKEAKAL